MKKLSSDEREVLRLAIQRSGIGDPDSDADAWIDTKGGVFVIANRRANHRHFAMLNRAKLRRT